MGYNVNLKSSDVVLLNMHREKILKLWKDLNRPENNHLKRGGSYSGGKQTSWNFSWMESDYDKHVNSVEEVLDMLGFEYFVEDGNIHIDGYDSKTGNEDLFFKEISHLIEPGKIMSWVGEDSAIFAWYFDGKAMQEMDLNEAISNAIKMLAQKDIPEEKIETKVEVKAKSIPHRYKNLL